MPGNRERLSSSFKQSFFIFVKFLFCLKLIFFLKINNYRFNPVQE